jgi:hypothetical protein
MYGVAAAFYKQASTKVVETATGKYVFPGIPVCEEKLMSPLLL